MQFVRVVGWLFSLIAAISGVTVVDAQTFPTKPIRMVTTQPGSGFDVATRMIADGLTASLGQPVIVDNRGGAGGVIAGEIVARAQPDGHTLLSYGPAIWLIPFMRKNVPYDPLKDFSPITLAVTAPNVLVVHPSVAANSVKELIALARAKPGELNYGGGNTGSSAHLAAELFKSMAGIPVTAGNAYGSGLRSAGLRIGGGTMVVGSSPEQLAAAVKADMETSGKLIRELGIRGD